MKHIVFDCDNTIGITDCDVDDGLALFYLLGCKEAAVHGITTTYGNSTLDVVYEVTKEVLNDLGRGDIALKRGGACAGDIDHEAADYLVEMADKYQGELSILATGSLTNLYSAYQKDAHFFEKVKEIVLMGGITTPLVFEKKVMDELNFSCDPKASYTVLTKGHHVSAVTGNNCLKVLFSKEEYQRKLSVPDNEMAQYILKKTDYYFGYNERDYGIKGFYNWDVTAAVYLMHPELFDDVNVKLTLSEADLQKGYLQVSENGRNSINLPEIGEEEPFKRAIFDAWRCYTCTVGEENG